MKKVALICSFIFGIAVVAFSEQAAPGEDVIARHLFPPELVMRFQQKIGLQENQSSAIKTEIQKNQSTFIDLQWQLQSEAQKMVALLDQDPVDEASVLSQADKVMDLERQIKKTHLTLLVRIKNLLSQEQKAKLKELQKNESN